METKTDMYGLIIRLTILDKQEVYLRQDNLIVKLPIGSGWDRALSVMNAHQPANWMPPEPPPET